MFVAALLFLLAWHFIQNLVKYQEATFSKTHTDLSAVISSAFL
jgi:hypothetical protein